MAREVASRGVNVVLVARQGDVLAQLAADLAQQFRVQTHVIAADLSTEAGLEAVTAGTTDLDVGLLVAAAGFGTSGSFLDADVRAEREMLNINCWAVTAQALTFGRRFARRGHGGMVLFASLVGFQGVPRAAHYSATKSYVQSLAEALHVELAPQGVAVLASAPGPVHSGFASRAGMQMGMALTPADVARATIGALGRHATVVPGGLSKLLTYSLRPLPRWARVRILGRIMGGMTSRHS